MLSFDRRFILTGLVALGACGFTPVHAPGGAGDVLRGAVRVGEPEDREGYELVKRLEQRLGQPGAPRYSLSYDIEVDPVGSGVTAAQEITRTRLDGTVTFAVTEIGTDTVVETGTVTSFTSFSNIGSTVSTASVERDAYRRLMVALADLLVARLVATAPGWPA